MRELESHRWDGTVRELLSSDMIRSNALPLATALLLAFLFPTVAAPTPIAAVAPVWTAREERTANSSAGWLPGASSRFLYTCRTVRASRGDDLNVWNTLDAMCAF